MDPASSESSDVLVCSQGMMGMEGALFSGTLQGQQRTQLAGGKCPGGWLGAGESKTLGHGTLWKLRRGVARFLWNWLWLEGTNASEQWERVG